MSEPTKNPTTKAPSLASQGHLCIIIQHYCYVEGEFTPNPLALMERRQSEHPGKIQWQGTTCSFRCMSDDCVAARAQMQLEPEI